MYRVSALLIAFFVPTAEATQYEIDVSKELMGTYVEATLVCEDPADGRAALLAAFLEMERISDLLGYDAELSEIESINRAAGRYAVRVSEDTFALLSRAAAYGDTFDGLFDVTTGVLSHAWGTANGAEARIPSPDALSEARALIDIAALELDASDQSARLTTSGMRIDLGGIAKGYAVDQASALLNARGYSSFLINAGGDMYVAGHHADGTPWRVGVQHPRLPDALIATIELADEAIATSGDYERYAIVSGRRVHHLFDPRTGEPGEQARGGTAIATSAEEADVLATIAFIRGEVLATESLVVTPTGEVRVTGQRFDLELEPLSEREP